MIYDVVIAGGGPVGLFLACELRLAGVSVLVLEKASDPHSPLKAGWMGMRGLSILSVESFYRRGLLHDLRGCALGWMNVNDRPGMELRGGSGPSNQTEGQSQPPPPRFAGHFAGIMLDANKIDFSAQSYTIPGPSAAGGMVSLEAMEMLLAERATELGVEIRRGMEVSGLTEDADSVTVLAGGESFQARWLVGCDGGRSAVRKLAGFEFAGTEPEFTGYAAAVKIVDPEKLRPGFTLTPTGMYIVGPGPDRIGMMEFDGAAYDRTQTPTLEHLQAVLRRISGTDVSLSQVDVATTYTDRACQATTYRRGRVLLAGDAAHIHSPLGGQGLNTGLGDAMNLGWKLAAAIKGWAPAGLLDSYTEERHPVGAWAVEWTRAQVAIMRPDPHAQAIAKVIRDLIQTKDATNYFVGKVSGITTRYELGDGHPLVGCSAPDFELVDGARLGELMLSGCGVLLDFAGGLEDLARPYAERVKYVASTAKDDKGFKAVLVRPDGIVAWVSDSEVGVEAVLGRWFG